MTHIFVTENLSAKKAQHYLEARRKNGTKLVTPEWAIACAERGKRVSEAKYAAPVFNEVRSFSGLFSLLLGSGEPLLLLDKQRDSNSVLRYAQLQESTYAFFSRSSAADPPNPPPSKALPPPPFERPGARTRSSYKQTEGDSSPPEPGGPARQTPEPSPAPHPSVILPAAPVSPLLRRSPRRSLSTTTTTTTATALLLAEIKAAKAQRSPSRSPASKAAERKRGWCATWECVVESPGSRKKRKGETRQVEKEKEKENGAAAASAARRGRSKAGGKEAKPPAAAAEEEEVLVLVSSDAEDSDLPGPPPSCGGGGVAPPYKSPMSESEAGTDAEEEDEEDEWSLPPSAQRR